MTDQRPDVTAVFDYLTQLQDSICGAFEEVDRKAKFLRRELVGERGGLARPRVLEGGPFIEKSAVNFSHTRGASLPPAATKRRPELAGRGFEAVSLSLIVHPRNPLAPTTHMNLRLFCAQAPESEPNAKDVWWFGGGFDLTPYYGFEEDAVFWHQTAKEACDPFGTDVYPQFKRQCDEYFYLPHRKETRGIGGLFYDDLNEGGFERCFGLTRSIGDHFLLAYRPILEKRCRLPYDEAHRAHQLLRRGRYVEFNLLYDRGTLFGLQAGGRTESILASLPPMVNWQYDVQPEEGTPEHDLVQRFLTPRDWLASAAG